MSQLRRSRIIRTGAIATAAAGALLLAGCSGSGGDSTNTDAPIEFSLATAVSDGDVDNAYQILAKEYMKQNPNIKITINGIPLDTYGQTLTTQLNAGNASDVFQTAPGTGQGSSIIPLGEAGLLEPVDEAASLIPSGSESQFQVDDTTYGVPLSITYVGTVFNKTASESSGLAIPGDFDTLISECGDARDAGMTLFTLAGAAPPNAGIAALSIAATRVYAETPDWNDQRADGDVTFADSQGWKDALQAILDMNGAGCFQDGVAAAGFDALIQPVAAGDAIALFAPSGSYVDIGKAGPDSEFAVGPFPPAKSSDKPFGYVSSNYALSVSAASKNKDAALAFAQWMSEPEQSAEFAKQQGGLPVAGLNDLDLSTTAYADVADVIQSGSYVPLPNASWPNAAVYDALGAGVQGLLTGQMTVDAVLQSMDTAWG